MDTKFSSKEWAIMMIALDVAISQIEAKYPASTKERDLLKSLLKRVARLAITTADH